MNTKELLPVIEIENEKYDEDSYEEMLNECYGTVEICGMTFNSGNAIKELDPTAFRCGMNDSQEYETVYACPICEKEFDDEDEALYCCQSDEIYECEHCGETFSDEDECEEHEASCSDE